MKPKTPPLKGRPWKAPDILGSALEPPARWGGLEPLSRLSGGLSVGLQLPGSPPGPAAPFGGAWSGCRSGGSWARGWGALRLFGLALVALGLLAACAASPPGPGPSAAGQGPRVVSLTPSLTEILFSLGAGGRVVGVTANDTYPPQVRDLPKVGDMNLDYEKIVALHPDVVVVDGSIAGEERLARLQELGIPVRSFESQSLEGLQATLLELGRLTGTEERARQLARRFADGIAEVRRRAAHMPRRPRVFVEIQDSPLMTAGGRHSRGGQTFVDLMISLAGGVNAYADLMDYPQVSPEDLLERDPDVIVLLSPPHRQVSQAVRRPGWDRLRAVKEGRVHLIEADLLVRPTLRTLVALQELQGWFTRAAAAP